MMSDCIKPWTKVYVFRLLEMMAGGGVHIPCLSTSNLG